MFYMPHMIYMDNDGFLWVTDVALHQVLKLDQNGTIVFTIGSKLQPGAGQNFCKPTQVCVQC